MSIVLVVVSLASLPLTVLDAGLAGVAQLAARGEISAAEEEAAVRRILEGDEGLALLGKHFGSSSSYGSLLRSALGLPAAASAAARAPATPPQQCAAASTSVPGVAFDALVARRSVKEYDRRPVPNELVQRALAAAVLAPNHFLTEPWRFYVLGEKSRAALVELNPAKQEAFAAVPGWMVVTVAASEYAQDGSLSTKKGLEDHAATACAVQNFMLSLAASGCGSKWMTGALGIAPAAILDLVKANATAERFMGAIWFGYPKDGLAAVPTPARKLGVAGVMTVLD